MEIKDNMTQNEINFKLPADIVAILENNGEVIITINNKQYKITKLQLQEHYEEEK